MKNRIHYASSARRDLDAIWDHIALELENVTAADRVVDRIVDEVDRLETFAELGAPLSSIANVEEDYRFLVSGSYMIFCRVMGSDVYVDRILYGRRDYLSVLLK